MSAAATISALPDDLEISGNKYCAVCNQSISASRVAAHLISQKHTNRAEKAKKGEDEVSSPALPVKSTSAPAISKPPVKALAASKTKKRDPDAHSSDSSSDPSSDDEPAPSRKVASKTGASSSSKDKLLRDPNKEGNYWCGICKVSLAPTRVDAHLQTEKHEKNQMKIITAAMRGL
jgi:hypothetical protein